MIAGTAFPPPEATATTGKVSGLFQNLHQNQSRDRSVRHFSITNEQLLLDICQAYRNARKNKKKRAYQLKFEFNLEDNLVNLRDELYAGTYRPGPSSCFINDPKMREVFAAEFMLRGRAICRCCVWWRRS